MKKKIILIVVSMLTVSLLFITNIKLLYKENVKNNDSKETVIEHNDKNNDNQEEQEIKIPESVEERKKVTEETKENQQNIKTDENSKTVNKSNLSKDDSSSKQIDKQTTPVIEEIITEIPKSKEDEKTLTESTVKEDRVIKYYEYITGGIKEYDSENKAITAGNKIVDMELMDVISQNKLNGENTVKPDIKNVIVYPSVVDKDGNTWYYLHFLCNSSDNCDKNIKKRFKLEN